MTTTQLPIPASTRPRRGGGLNRTMLGLEVKRVLSNKRALFFTVLFPVLMLLIVASTVPEVGRRIEPSLATVGAYVAVSMALYGASMAASSAGASISAERANGWSRQLRLTPLRPIAYIATKVLAAVVVGGLSLAVTYAVAALTGTASMPARAWVETGLVILAGGLVFAALGLMLGLLVRSENVTQVTGPLMALLGFLGGLFQGPVDVSTLIGRIQSWSPIYGLSQLAHWPLSRTASGELAPLDWSWVVNLSAWGVLFVGAAAWLFRRDTARV